MYVCMYVFPLLQLDSITSLEFPSVKDIDEKVSMSMSMHLVTHIFLQFQYDFSTEQDVISR